MSYFAPANQYIPQTVSDRRPWIAWSAVTLVCLLAIAMILGAPLAQANGFAYLSFPIYNAFSYVCHQDPERSFFVAGQQFAVCTRCTGIYAGFTATMILYPLLFSPNRSQTPERKWLFLAALPLTIDFSLGFLGVWQNTHVSRFSTGAILGAAAVFFVVPGLADLSRRFAADRVSDTGLPQERSSEPSQETPAPSDYSAPFRRI